MSGPAPKLNHYKLETEFHEDHVVHTTYEWQLATRLRRVSTWERGKRIGAGAFGSVWLEKEREGGKLRAVKRLPRDFLPDAGFSQELLALVKLKVVSSLG